MFGADDKVIVKGVGGFYYVKTAGGVLETKAKGIFRKRDITPLAGDAVELGQSGGDYVIEEIHKRKNFLSRPPVANIDLLVLVVSAVLPEPNRLVIDTLTAIAEKKGIEPVIVLTKTDIADGGTLVADYRKAGFEAIDLQADLPAAEAAVKDRMRGCFSVFSGNSGAGKSTLLNRLFPDLRLPTAEVSRKLGRGRHTTRAVEIFQWGGGYFADTPGFSAIDIERAEPIGKEELRELFFDFLPFAADCRYTGCAHLAEPGCAVTAALRAGRIAESRYQSYRELSARAIRHADTARKSR